MRDIFRRFAAGESLRGLVRQLGEHGIPTRRGGKWSTSTVLAILRNPRYAGRAVSTGSTNGHAALGPAIVEQAVFDVVQARL
ncbi:MAG: recombinase family protein, partial [Acidobacteria bacterium]|nr:recombinase family protein [Acidobacteriota bacterium]